MLLQSLVYCINSNRAYKSRLEYASVLLQLGDDGDIRHGEEH